jgi:UPF0755 protein
MFKELAMHNSSIIRKIAITLLSLIALGLITLVCVYLFIIRAPFGTVYPVKITIENGQGVQSIANELYENGIVQSRKLTQNLIVSSGGEKKIPAGMYIFEQPLSMFGVAQKITSGDFDYVPVKITIPEGTNSKRLASIVNSKFPHIATSTFQDLAREKEGYLFPETYFFNPEATPEEIIERMSYIFEAKISSLQEQIQQSGKSLQEILILASILEGEVQTTEDRGMVADLLNRRIKIGMPLQVDTTLGYILGKTSAELTLKDLQIDSPYNTYANKGLPPAPISNPGLNSIEAVLHPIPNQYIFYLSDKDGITRFSKTHDEHVRLKQKYLR